MRLSVSTRAVAMTVSEPPSGTARAAEGPWAWRGRCVQAAGHGAAAAAVGRGCATAPAGSESSTITTSRPSSPAGARARRPCRRPRRCRSWDRSKLLDAITSPGPIDHLAHSSGRSLQQHEQGHLRWFRRRYRRWPAASWSSRLGGATRSTPAGRPAHLSRGRRRGQRHRREELLADPPRSRPSSSWAAEPGRAPPEKAMRGCWPSCAQQTTAELLKRSAERQLLPPTICL